jgi:L-aminopeptidase/D-esterase-like protein
VSVRLPGGVRAGHWTDAGAGTGCTVVLIPDRAVVAVEVRGGGPGSRETDLLSPASPTPGVNAILLTGGSAFGLAAADGVVRWLEERGVGYPAPAGAVPLVAGLVVYDLALGAAARPDAAAGYAACDAASADVHPGNVGAGAGCTVGKARGHACWMRGGLGVARLDGSSGTAVAAIAVVNAFGDVLAADGSVLAGVREGGRRARTAALLRDGVALAPRHGESTTLVCVVTDADLSKTGAWQLARAAAAGVARAVDPVWTAVDGDAMCCVATGERPADELALAALAADVVAEAIRDAARAATGLPGCPAARDLA